MRRSVLWILVLVLGSLAVLPAAAAEDARVIGGHINGCLTSSTGKQLPLGSGQVFAVDAFNLATWQRYVTFVSDPDSDGCYTLDVLPGTYAVRFRYWNAAGELNRYRWYDDRRDLAAADPVFVGAGGTTFVNGSLPPIKGSPVSGTITDNSSGLPLGGPCFYVELFEADGISLGQLLPVDAVTGTWQTLGEVPTGRYTALAGYSTYACPSGPVYLDRWYRIGASGQPLHPDNLATSGPAFGTARLFRVRNGIPVTGIDVALLPAPLCRGKLPTIYGTTLDDAIYGTDGRDIIVGLRGDDEIRGFRGNDLLCGNEGNDLLSGGAGPRDLADGGSGTDICDAEREFNCP